jgi:hypothetical protein
MGRVSVTVGAEGAVRIIVPPSTKTRVVVVSRDRGCRKKLYIDADPDVRISRDQDSGGYVPRRS